MDEKGRGGLRESVCERIKLWMLRTASVDMWASWHGGGDSHRSYLFLSFCALCSVRYTDASCGDTKERGLSRHSASQQCATFPFAAHQTKSQTSLY